MSISAQEPHDTHRTVRLPSRNIAGLEMSNAIHLGSKMLSGTQPPDPQVMSSASRSRARDMESLTETGVRPSGRLGLLGHPRAVDLYEARMCTSASALVFAPVPLLSLAFRISSECPCQPPQSGSWKLTIRIPFIHHASRIAYVFPAFGVSKLALAASPRPQITMSPSCILHLAFLTLVPNVVLASCLLACVRSGRHCDTDDLLTRLCPNLSTNTNM